MHNVNVDALEQTIAKVQQDTSAVKQRVAFDGERQTQEGGRSSARASRFPTASPSSSADFPPPMGGTESAPNPPPTASGRARLLRDMCASGQRTAVAVQCFGAKDVILVVGRGVPKWGRLGHPIEAPEKGTA